MDQPTNLELKSLYTTKPATLLLLRQRLKLFNIQMPSQYFSLSISLVFILLFNKSFFFSAWNTQALDSFNATLFAISLVPILWLLTFFFVNLVCLPGLVKPTIIFLLLSGSLASYFMDAYGIGIDKEMLRNAWETDIKETQDLINPHLISYVVFLGILPSILVLKTRISWGTFRQELKNRIVLSILSVFVSLLLILSLSSFYSSFFRNHKEVRLLANPLGFINAGVSLLREKSQRPIVIDPISHEATLGPGTIQQTKPLLVIFVVGETARAANFGTNGYPRNTTPLLAQKDIVNFNNVASCGTSTAVSLPCMFSAFSRSEYSDSKAKSQHGLLDFINTVGIDVLWRDNNSGCKGACDRIPYESSGEMISPEQCKDGNCFDEILLKNLSNKLTGRNQFIVLHQKGSHGPAYDQRYPESMRVFQPVCNTNRLQDCSIEQVINSYDNSIRYTDFFLSNVIDWLNTLQASYNTVMVYVSDHGESLGENNLYLHGMPYAIAPEQQKHVPFIFWASSSFYRDRGLSKECLMNIKSQDFSHDNIFHSFLGLLDIKTKYYQSRLDIYAPCINHR